MSATTKVGSDVATRHVLVAATAFKGRLAAFGSPIDVPRGYVFMVTPSLGQTNIYHGAGPRHPNGTLIEHATAVPGNVLSEDEVVNGMKIAAAKQAEVPDQIAAREARARTAREALAPPLTKDQHAALLSLIAKK